MQIIVVYCTTVFFEWQKKVDNEYNTLYPDFYGAHQNRIKEG